MDARLILILGDQLTPGVSSLAAGDAARDVVLMAEVMEEASYVGHHKKKLAFVFAAMRHFAEELRAAGWRVDYVCLDDPRNTGSLTGEVARARQRHGLTRTLVTEPGEYRLLAAMERWPETQILPDRRFLADARAFVGWAEGRAGLRMEHFYRLMRHKTGLLMEIEGPAGGKWNYDHDNRGRAHPDADYPAPCQFAPDAITRAVLDLVAARFPDNFGALEPFWFATTRGQAEAAFGHFLRAALPDFGATQDAMLRAQPFLNHALIALYLNAGLLDPRAVCQAVEEEWRAGRVPLNSAEGFIRQIIGWREYVRCLYWWQMPAYAGRNALGATRPLPWFYWSAETDMACMGACLAQTRDEAYAHHIQRLMVTGNFALLAGVDPHALHEWYLSVYADAYEWVELPNTMGMSQFADGGLLASKPYVASGAYINRMSDYCGACRYDVKAKAGEDACPFNYLYWDFIARHAERWSKNPRMAQMVATYHRMGAARREEIARDSARFLAAL